MTGLQPGNTQYFCISMVAVLLKNIRCTKVLLARSMTRLHLQEHWVTDATRHLPGYSVVESAHGGAARVLRCGLTADGQFVVFVL